VSPVAVLAVVFAVVAVAELIALAVMAQRLRRTQGELAGLQRSLRETVPSGPVATTGRLVKAVVQGAARVREQGVAGTLSSSVEELVEWAKQDRAKIVRVAAPDGTVTFFFSDIENSTAVNEELGDAEWLRTLDAHNRIVERSISTHDGFVVKTVGDGFMAVFAEAGAAGRAALDIQAALPDARSRRLRRTALKVRIGIHTGTAVARGGDYFGRNVALCARIAEHAVGGETLASGDARAAVGDDPALAFEPRGDMTFRGITGPTEVFSVVRGT
jgi:adenylate cyclase